MMKQNIFSLLLTSIVTLSGITVVSPQPAYSQNTRNIDVYSLNYNRHGRVLRTSVGIFYVGKSGDVILRTPSGRKYHGYWEQEPSILYVYIANTTYYFYI